MHTRRSLYALVITSLILLIDLVSGSLAVSAQGIIAAEISNVSCEGLGSSVEYTFTLIVENARGSQIHIGVWPVDSISNSLIAFAGGESARDFSDPNGYVTSHTMVTPLYDSTTWEEFKLSIPSAAFPSAAGSTYSFYPYIEIQNARGQTIQNALVETCLVSMSVSESDAAVPSEPDGPSVVPPLDSRLDYQGMSEVTLTYLDFGGNAIGTETYSIPDSIVVIKPPLSVDQFEAETNPFNLFVGAGAGSPGDFGLVSASILTTPTTGRRVISQDWIYEIDSSGIVEGTLGNPLGLDEFASQIFVLRDFGVGMELMMPFPLTMRDGTTVHVRFPTEDTVEVRVSGLSRDETVAFEIVTNATLR